MNATPTNYKNKPLGRRARVGAILMSGVVALGIAVSGAPTAALAGQATSGYKTYSVGGVSYKNRAVVNTNISAACTHSAYAVGLAYPTSKSVAAGWIGIEVKLFRSNGAVAKSSGWQYNPKTVAQNTPFNPETASACDATAYYAQAATVGWTGTKYSSGYLTYRSPNQNS
ncbi:MAG: hypothetical protein LBJ62_02945 [Bifidobacteriaceae bacterium]|jgi:hypothetical protein|nr:hypothetical protein [Bifidobacteriaceae bacterium]